mgnify:CR=1 FL=1
MKETAEATLLFLYQPASMMDGNDSQRHVSIFIVPPLLSFESYDTKFRTKPDRLDLKITDFPLKYNYK